MEFINEGKAMKVRVGTLNSCHWITLKHNEFINLSKEAGKSLGLKEVEEIKATEGQVGNVKVETKQVETKKKDYQKKLEGINGVGKKTAKDIMIAFPKEEDLKTKIHNNENLPFRDDVEKLLKKEYGERISKGK